MPAAIPKTIEASGGTNPAAGVMQTSPATAPDAPPGMVGLAPRLHSAATHARRAAAPHPVRERVVEEGRPQEHVEREGGEAHALGEGARDERGRNDRERRLIDDEEDVRNRRRHGARGPEDAFHAEEVEAADEAALG